MSAREPERSASTSLTQGEYRELLEPYIEALNAARGSLEQSPDAGVSIRRIARAVERKVANRGLHAVAQAAGRVGRAETPDVGAELRTLLELLEAVVAGRLRPGSAVLLVEDDPATVALLSLTLERAGRSVVSADSLEAVLAALHDRVVEVVLLDLGLPDLDGREILSALKAHPATAPIPVLVLTASNEPWVRAECLALGAAGFLSKPIDPRLVVAALNAGASLEAAAGGELAEDRVPGSLEALVGESDPLTAKLISQRLIREGFAVRLFSSGSALLREAERLTPAVVVMDSLLPGVEGLELVSRLRALPSYRQLPIILLSSVGSEREVVRALEAGADDCLRKPFSPAELMARIDRLLRRRER